MEVEEISGGGTPTLSSPTAPVVAEPSPLSPAAFIDTLQRKINEKDFDCSKFSSLDEAACLIFQAAYGTRRTTTAKPISDRSIFDTTFKTYFALEAVNYIQNTVSSPRYSLLKARLGPDFKQPGTDAALCIDLGIGICGNHAAVFLDLMQRVGVEARAVQFFYNTKYGRESHIAAEVNIDGWRYLDSTWAAFWYSDVSDPIGSIVSVKDLLKSNKKYHVSVNSSHPWYIQAKYNVDPLGYLKMKPSVIYGYSDGVVKINDVGRDGKTINLAHIPNFIGDNQPDRSFKGISYQFPVISKATQLVFETTGVGGCDSGRSKLCVNDNCQTIIPEKIRDNPMISIAAKRPRTIKIVSTEDVCYVVFKTISAENSKLKSRKLPKSNTIPS